MLRIVAILALLTSTAFAQVVKEDESLQEQLVPESFKFEASAVAAYSDQAWRTAITYALTNNSGMNLYMGVKLGGVSIGACTSVNAGSGGLPILHVPGSGVFSTPQGMVSASSTYVPAGARVAGTIVMMDCQAPNPGSPTAQVSISLLIGKSRATRGMITYPISAEAKIRQVQPQ